LFYSCPSCQTPSCELSSQCRVCGILLLSSSKLSRTSQQHGPLFKIAPFIPIGKFLITAAGADNSTSTPDPERVSLLCSRNLERNSVLFMLNPNGRVPLACFGCDKAQSIIDSRLNSCESVVCPRCICLFCIDCDIFIHQTLLCCPGCTN